MHKKLLEQLQDPREYLPFLQRLQELPTLRRRYTTDNHLGRYGKALQHLYELGVFDELTLYTQKHSLYVQALDLYRYQEESLKVILRLYAEHLQQESKHKEAGIGMYEGNKLYDWTDMISQPTSTS